MFRSLIRNRALAIAALLIGSTIPVQTNAQASRLSETRSLESELASTQASIRSSRQRQERLKSTIRDFRKDLENTKTLIAGLKKIEDKIGRIEREVNSLSRVPQLKWLKPVRAGLVSLKSKVHTIRKKGEEFKRQFVDPMISKAKKLENQVARTITKLKGLEAKATQARQNIAGLRQFVEANIRQAHLVRAIEQLARQTRSELRPVSTALRDIDNSAAGVEGKIKSASSSLKQMTKLKSAITKMDRKLAPIDNKAKKIAKVMNKKLEFKLPFGKKKKVSVSARKILESPGNIAKVALKPLQKLANKALGPVNKKIKVDIKAPAELEQLSRKFDQLKNTKLNLDATTSRLQKATSARELEQYLRAAERIIRTHSRDLR